MSECVGSARCPGLRALVVPARRRGLLQGLLQDPVTESLCCDRPHRWGGLLSATQRTVVARSASARPCPQLATRVADGDLPSPYRTSSGENISVLSAFSAWPRRCLRMPFRRGAGKDPSIERADASRLDSHRRRSDARGPIAHRPLAQWGGAPNLASALAKTVEWISARSAAVWTGPATSRTRWTETCVAGTRRTWVPCRRTAPFGCGTTLRSRSADP